MKTIKTIISTWGNAGHFLLMLCVVAVLSACSKDPVEERFLDLKDAPDYLSFSTTGGSQSYEMYSNWKEWNIVVDYDTEDQTWVDVWPNKGSDDGRFKITVGENKDDAYYRVARVTIIADNKIQKIITVEQDEVTSVLELDMDGISTISSTNRESTTTVRLKTNVYWEAEALGDAASWIKFGERTHNTLELVFDRNMDEDSRQGYVNLAKIGTGNEGVNVKIKVVQRGAKDDQDKAFKTTIAELLANGKGLIEDNCFIEGFVTNDLATYNIDSAYVFVQDESKRGLKIELLKQADNTFKLNDKLKLHMVGQSIVADNVNGGTKVASFPMLALLNKESGGTGAEPAEVTDLSKLNDYENTLVTLKNVEFAHPYGTYVNIDENNYKAAGNPTSINLGDTPRMYGNIVRDANGNSVKLYTGWQFTDKFTLIPAGSGDLTGIVMKRTVNGTTGNIVRLRSNADNKVSKEASTRISRTVVRFGPWTYFGSMAQIKADVGTGSIKTHIYENCEIASGSNMYWSWTYARRVETTMAPDFTGLPALPDDADKTNVIYSCLNQSDWLSAAGSTVEDYGGAWIANISQKGQTITGPLVLTFTTSSSQTGPRDFTVEWADKEDTKNADWKKIGTYESCDWNSNYHLLQYTFRLPDALKSKETYVLRLRVTGKGNARGNGNFATGGTNRIGFFEVSEMK